MTKKDYNEVFLLTQQYEFSYDICEQLKNAISFFKNELKQKTIGEDTKEEMQQFVVKLENAFNDFEVYL